MKDSDSPLTSRRDFLKSSSAAALAGTFAAPFILASSGKDISPGDTLRVGLIGCGGRGNGAAADALKADGSTVLYAMGDVFEARIEAGLKEIQKDFPDAARVQVPTERRFVGIDAFEKVLASGVDVVLLTTPPGFRPSHFKAAVDLKLP